MPAARAGAHPQDEVSSACDQLQGKAACIEPVQLLHREVHAWAFLSLHGAKALQSGLQSQRDSDAA